MIDDILNNVQYRNKKNENKEIWVNNTQNILNNFLIEDSET